MALSVRFLSKIAFLCATAVFSVAANEADSKLLISSIQNKDMKGIEIALKRGADVNYELKSDTYARTPLGTAFIGFFNKKDQVELSKTHKIIELLLRKKAVVPTNQNELFTVYCYGSKKTVSLLLLNGLNPHLKLYGYTTAEFAVKYENTELLPLLYSRNVPKVDPETRVQLELIAGAHRYDIQKMETAIKAGAKVNKYDPGGETALCVNLDIPLADFACKNVISLVIGHDANPNMPTKTQDGNGNYPLHLAISKSYGLPKIENIMLIVGMLIERGADVNARNEFMETPLHSAAKHNLVPVVRALLAKGADPKARDFRGREPSVLTTSLEIKNLIYAASKP